MEPPIEPGAVSERVVRVTSDEARADEWALVLEAAAIEHRVDGAPGGPFCVVVPPEREGSALASLDGYDAERAAARAQPPAPDYGPTRIGAIAAALLCGFYLVAARTALPWHGRGSAVAQLILDGEPWRVLTALTLHADLAHLAGNALALWVLLAAVARRLGPAAAAWLTLATGAAGNLLVALLHRTHHVSIGASTATFGALGLLAGIHLATRRGARRWLAAGAALALLGMLGVGAGSDVFAHLFGLLSGAALGAGAALATPNAPRRTVVQPLAAAAAVAPLVAAWLLALR